VLAGFGAEVPYLANAVDPGIGMSWVAPGFDASGWPVGAYGIGYDGDVDFPTLVATTIANPTRSVYTRFTFEIDDVLDVQNLFLGAEYDDGWVAWINGVEVYRSIEIPAGPLAWNTSALDDHDPTSSLVPYYEPLIDISAAGVPALQNGTNVLAVGAWNRSTPSNLVDLLLLPRLIVNRNFEIVRGPYLQLGTPASMTVRWRTATPRASRVLYGSAPDQLDVTVQSATPVTEHVVTLSGLNPDTRYYYAVGDATEVFVGHDERHSFVTPPVPGTPKPTRIWVLGDSGRGNRHAYDVRDAYDWASGELPVDLWLMLGDNAYTEGTDAEFQTGLFDVYRETLRRSVLWPCVGNHDSASADSDTQTGPYFDIFTLPTTGEAGGVPSGTEAYYSFDYGNIHFVVLESHETDRSPGGPMMAWLEQDLAANTRDWTIAYWHHPPYSKGGADSDIHDQGYEMRENAVPILEDYGVDLVLSGHAHNYERSFLIDGHYGESTTLTPEMVLDGGDGREEGDGAYVKPGPGPVPHEGAVYTVAGSSSGTEPAPFGHPVMVVWYNLPGSMVLEIEGGRLDAAFWDKTGTALDHFTILKDAADPDLDGDGVPGSQDNCPGVANAGQADADLDGAGDACDNCPALPNPGQANSDGDALGDGCDNCPGVANAGQADADLDGAGDACDNCPALVNPSQSDVDADAQGDHCDVQDGLIYVTLPFDNRVRWQAEQGYTSWNLYRGDLDVLRATGVYTQLPGSNSLAQQSCGLLLTFAVDSVVPSPLDVAFYLATGVSGGVESGLGEGRPNDNPCP
jgi:hypothetical protein